METKISEISEKNLDRLCTIQGIVDSIMQTTGPTLFTLSDGTGTFTLKSFEGPGVRAYPSIKIGDSVEALIKIKEFENAFEGDVMKLSKLNDSESKKFREVIEKRYTERAKPHIGPFLVKSKILDKLKDSFVNAAREIRLAIIKNRPIILRHHNDTDGYSSGYALERAILGLIREQHKNEKALRQYFTRAPSASPFYELEDSIRDTAHSLSNLARFSEKIPLILIVDTGSSEESLLGIKQGKVHGIDFIVIDHHFSEKDLISKEVLSHINPFLVGEDGSKFSAGMLCTELARFINPIESIEYIPAIAGIADVIDNPEVMEEYFKIAHKKGYTKDLLKKIASVIDFVSTKLRFMESREYVEVLFGEDIDNQKKLVEILAPHIENLEKNSLAIAEKMVKTEKHGKVTLNLLFIEETFSRGAYPKPGKSNGQLHDSFKQKGEKFLISAGVLNDAITFRATEESKFSVHDFISLLHKKLPEAFVEGGGHKSAGAIRFVPSKRDEILDKLREFLAEL